MSLTCQLILSLGRDRISPKFAPFPPCVCVCCVYLQTLWYLDLSGHTKIISGFYLDIYLDLSGHTRIISGLSLDTFLDLSGHTKIISGFIWIITGHISGFICTNIWIYLDTKIISGFIWTHIWTQRLYLDYHGSTWSTYRKRPYVSVQTPAQGFILDQQAHRFTHCTGGRHSSNERSSSNSRSILDLAGQYLIFKGEADERASSA